MSFQPQPDRLLRNKGDGSAKTALVEVTEPAMDRLEPAVRTQTEALAAAGQDAAQTERMSRNLELYERGEPCRDPGSIVP